MKAEEIKKWTASDAKDAVFIVDDNGLAWQVFKIEWDGTVHVAATKEIKPNERNLWKLYKLPK